MESESKRQRNPGETACRRDACTAKDDVLRVSARARCVVAAMFAMLTSAHASSLTDWKLGVEFVAGKIATPEGGEIAFAHKPATGPALILSPGTFSDRRNFAPLTSELAQRIPSLRIVVVEHRGVGAGWPPNAKPSIEASAADVALVAEKLCLKRFFVGGHSLGGMIAIEMARKYPERLLGVVAIEGWTNAGCAKAAFANDMRSTLSKNQEAELEAYRRDVLKRWSDDQRKEFGTIWRRWDGSQILKATALPVLAIYGDRGRSRPSHSLLGLPDRPNVQLVWLANASHSLPYQRPKALATLIDQFIRNQIVKQSVVGATISADVAVLGATPGGIATALAAARENKSVVLVEQSHRIGGMSTAGLGKSDVEHREAIGGSFREFTRKVQAHYIHAFGPTHENVRLCRDGYYFEPAVAECAFEAMLGMHANVMVLRGRRLLSARKAGNRLVGIETTDKLGCTTSLGGKVFIDASYEGDLLAAAGAKFRLGRESRAEFGEPHAGQIYCDYTTGELLPGSTGQGDNRLPAYTYRLCLATDPKKSRPMPLPPPGYDRRNYLGYFDDLKAGRLDAPKSFKPGRGYNPAHFGTLVRALSVTPLPNGKTDVNINPRPLGFPFSEENRGYIEGDEATRERIRKRHRDLTLGLLWFLQNDEQAPAAHRALARQLNWPTDEFTDDEGFPHQLYVREGRRLRGLYTLTENDVSTPPANRPKRHPDSIAVGEFPIDSFPCQKRQPADSKVLEGYLGMLDGKAKPYELPYRIMIPESVDSLIVPVAASTTHVAFSSIRTEPTWMALGQAAGVAAALAIEHGVEPRHVSVPELQSRLAALGQVVRLP